MQDRLVVALVRELYFGAKLVDWVRSFGCKYKRVETRADLIKAVRSSNPALVVVDLECQPGDLTEITCHSGRAKLLAFGPPSDVESLEAARAAGFDEVVLNIQYHRELRSLLARHLPAEAPEEMDGEGKKPWQRLWPRT